MRVTRGCNFTRLKKFTVLCINMGDRQNITTRILIKPFELKSRVAMFPRFFLEFSRQLKVRYAARVFLFHLDQAIRLPLASVAERQKDDRRRTTLRNVPAKASVHLP